MAASLLPVGKAVRSRQPSSCYIFNVNLQQPKSIPNLLPYKKRTKQNYNSNKSVLLSPLVCQYRLRPVSALDSDVPNPIDQRSEDLKSSESFKQWDSLTAKFAGAANIPFLILQLPQIILNARNLLAGNNAALFAVPWLGMLTGLLGNLSLLSYFIKKRETEVVVVQTLGVVTIYIVISQLAMAGSMPFPHYAVTSVVIACGLVVNFMNYFYLLNPVIWRYWEDFITVAGLSALPQVMWSTFIPYVPNTILPGAVAFVVAILAVIMQARKFCMYFCVGRAIMLNLKEREHGSETILNFKLLFFTVTDWETSREGHQICRIIVWMDCHSSFHVDASFTNVDKPSKSR